MSVKMQNVHGMKKDSYGGQQPVVMCDGPSCKSKYVGNPGMGTDSALSVSMSHGFRGSADGKHYCAGCGAKGSK